MIEMASIFTYETGPIRLSSPWPERVGQIQPKPALATPIEESLANYNITKLEAEPQEGPVEYKLHLLLRPRRSFSTTSTPQKASGSHMSRSRGSHLKADDTPPSDSSTATTAPSTTSRQNRLHHLTTQLLWRLQQSCPHHASSKSELIVPTLPESDIRSSLDRGPRSLVGGIEESLGAMYEIGVSDDGSFIGLIREELDESLNILRAMAYSLGCRVEVLRVVDVGQCSWNEKARLQGGESAVTRSERLVVAEVLVCPNLTYRPRPEEALGHVHHQAVSAPKAQDAARNDSSRQLRVSLTGATTSGKSSLLGTLTTSTLDSGRGKSRLSLLKHRHEIDSGITSSLAQELIAYRDITPGPTCRVVNYASSNVSSWDDMHHLACPGRLVFVTDSAGHPRYRRTTVRGLLSWAPDWTLCCIAADEVDGSPGMTACSKQKLETTAYGSDISKAHLELCLKLDLPLVVVITKLDSASRDSIRQTCAKVLSVLKEAGRKPVIIPNRPSDGQTFPDETLPAEVEKVVMKAIRSPGSGEIQSLVPIILTSAMTGAGISEIHSLLHSLPLMPHPGNPDFLSLPASREPLFHIDEVFSLPKHDIPHGTNTKLSQTDCVLSGHLRFGFLTVGQIVLIGPGGSDLVHDVPEISPQQHYRTDEETNATLVPSAEVFQSASNGTLIANAAPSSPRSQAPAHWQWVTVTSIRYLRLPVRSLSAGQVATIGISATQNSSAQSVTGLSEPGSSLASNIRRGMVLLSEPRKPAQLPPAYASFAAIFKESNTYVIPGSTVTVYIASIRASAKIVEVRIPEAGFQNDHQRRGSNESAALCSFDGEAENDNDDEEQTAMMGSTASLGSQIPLPKAIEITFQFTANQEWIEMGTTVLVTPASGLSMVNPDVSDKVSMDGTGRATAGLDAFVGTIVRGGV